MTTMKGFSVMYLFSGRKKNENADGKRTMQLKADGKIPQLPSSAFSLKLKPEQ
jgi:hypothetical protein